MKNSGSVRLLALSIALASTTLGCWARGGFGGTGGGFTVTRQSVTEGNTTTTTITPGAVVPSAGGVTGTTVNAGSGRAFGTPANTVNGVNGNNNGTTLSNGTTNPTSVVVGSGFSGVSGWGAPTDGGTVQRMLTAPATQQVFGPMQVSQLLPFAVPTVLGMREVFTNGVPSTLTAPVVTEYAWPSRRKLK